MGYDIYSAPFSGGKIRVRVSRHNDERDSQDDEAVERLIRAIDELVKSDPEYRRVVVGVS